MLNKKNILFYVIFFSLMLMPLISAYNVSMEVKAPYGQRAFVTVLKDDGGYNYVASFNAKIGENNLAKFSFDTGLSTVDIGLLMRDDKGAKLSYERYGPFVTSRAILIDLIGAPEIIVNETATNETSENTTLEEDSGTADTTNSESSLFGGFAIFGEEGFITKNIKVIYYVFGGIALAVVVAFVLIMISRRSKRAPSFKKDDDVIIASDEGDDKDDDEDSKSAFVTEKKLREAENKLKKMQDEVSKIKKIKEIEQRFEEDRAELEKLKQTL